MSRAERRRQEKLARKGAARVLRQAASAPAIADLMREAVAHHRAGRLDEALALYHAVLDAAPDHPDANHLAGLVAHRKGDLQTAAAMMTRALRVAPDKAAIHNNLGLTLQASGRHEDAAASYRRALVLHPNFVEALCNLGNVHLDAGRPEAAEASYRKALAIDDTVAGVHYNLGNALRAQRRFDDAIAAFERAIALQPDYAKAHNNLADALKETDRIAKAMDHFRAACEIEPQSPPYLSSLIFMQDFDIACDLAEQQATRRIWNDRFAVSATAAARPHDNDRAPERRLRVGYVSADFRSHSAAQGFAPLILDHDADAFDVHCYAVNTRRDAMTERLRSAATAWRDVAALSDEALAETIRGDRIDILVDLSAHSEGNRLLTFARKPAPLQVTGIGHLAPGLGAIDYRYTTHDWTTPEEEFLFPEQPLYLSTLFAYLPPADAPPVAPPPCLQGKGFTFGSMNRLYKISDDAKALWAKILRDVPRSRLLVKFGGLESTATRERMERAFAAHGVATDRLILLGGSSQAEHLAAYNRVDITLDTFPTGGGITTMESLWMGVPVLSLNMTKKIVQRSARTFSGPVGLDDWVADNTGDYHDRAVAWSQRGQDLGELRVRLRERVTRAYSRITREVETAYRIMWRRWCAGEPPAPIDIAGGGNR